MTSNINNQIGYYRITIGCAIGKNYLCSNNERAFIVSQLQDLLSARCALEVPEPHKLIAAQVDLLAFSILPKNIQLVVFTINRPLLNQFSRLISMRLLQYQVDFSSGNTFNSPQVPSATLTQFSIQRLSGQHGALQATTSLHLRHTDWEYDRYSSIGFYLHDRRGPWMRLWRLTRLLENNPNNYRRLLTAQKVLTY